MGHVTHTLLDVYVYVYMLDRLRGEVDIVVIISRGEIKDIEGREMWYD